MKPTKSMTARIREEARICSEGKFYHNCLFQDYLCPKHYSGLISIHQYGLLNTPDFEKKFFIKIKMYSDSMYLHTA